MLLCRGMRSTCRLLARLSHAPPRQPPTFRSRRAALPSARFQQNVPRCLEGRQLLWTCPGVLITRKMRLAHIQTRACAGISRETTPPSLLPLADFATPRQLSVHREGSNERPQRGQPRPPNPCEYSHLEDANPPWKGPFADCAGGM